MAGSDFDEGADTIIVHGADLLSEVDRSHDLFGEGFPCLCGVLRVFAAAGVRVDRNPAFGEID